MAALHALVIDDHEAVREEVRENLDSLGHTCAMAGSREEALACLGAASFDYVLLDLEIPTRYGRPTLLAKRAIALPPTSGSGWWMPTGSRPALPVQMPRPHRPPWHPMAAMAPIRQAIWHPMAPLRWIPLTG